MLRRFFSKYIARGDRLSHEGINIGMKTILASASPRRRELLGYVVKDFDIIPSDVDETIPEVVNPENSAEYLAVKKAKAVSNEHMQDIVIGCDTVVILDGEVFGKPADKTDARIMLEKLSGRIHKVITGVCLCRENEMKSFSSVTEVEFYNLSEDEIEEYIATGEPMDKAGAYGIQGYGSLLVKEIHGDFFNVVGLPVSRLKREYDSFM